MAKIRIITEGEGPAIIGDDLKLAKERVVKEISGLIEDGFAPFGHDGPLPDNPEEEDGIFYTRVGEAHELVVTIEQKVGDEWVG